MLSTLDEDFKVGRKVVLYQRGKPDMIGIDVLSGMMSPHIFSTKHNHIVDCSEKVWTDKNGDNYGAVKVYVRDNT